MTLRRLLPALLLPGLLLTLAACASDEAKPARGGPRPVRLFISPSGEPFRGEDGLGRWLAQADTDHDGAVDLAEFRADARHSFQVLDANHDGVIDGFEMQAYERDVVPEIGVMTFDAGPTAGRTPGRGGGGGAGGGGGRRGGGMGRGGGRGGQGGSGGGSQNGGTASPQAVRVPGAGREGAARYSLINEPQPIAAADTDLDGKVTLAEWMAITDRRFARLDHAKTGKLTRESLLHPPKKDAAKAP
jgi:hypothetical protein